MVKYKVTSEHLFLKSGLILIEDFDDSDCFKLECKDDLYYSESEIILWVNKGWIKQIEFEEKQYTRRDMISFAKYLQQYHTIDNFYVELENWYKDRKCITINNSKSSCTIPTDLC